MFARSGELRALQVRDLGFKVRSVWREAVHGSKKEDGFLRKQRLTARPRKHNCHESPWKSRRPLPRNKNKFLDNEKAVADSTAGQNSLVDFNIAILQQFFRRSMTSCFGTKQHLQRDASLQQGQHECGGGAQ
eukprot:gene16963-biopygen11038